MFAHKIKFLKFLILISLVLTLSLQILAQTEEFDIEIDTQSTTKKVQEGENFSYKFLIKNIGTKETPEAYFNHFQPNMSEFVSFTPSKGKCEIYENGGYEPKLHCKLGSVGVEEIIYILVDIKVRENMDISKIKKYNDSNDKAAIIKDEKKSINTKPLLDFVSRITGEQFESLYGSQLEIIGRVGISQIESNEENNRKILYIERLPSLNIPPRIEITSPNDESIIKKNTNKPSEIIVNVKAFDTDGSIKRVYTTKSKLDSVFENGEYKYVLGGNNYTAKELKENYEELRKHLETELIKTGKNTYKYTIENAVYGINTISVIAEDDKGRTAFDFLRFDLIGDAEVNIVSPEKNQIFRPNSTIIIKTTSQINDPTLKHLKISGMLIKNQTFERPKQMPTQKEYLDYIERGRKAAIEALPVLKQTSKNGNTFEHQYIWKNVPEGNYSIGVNLFNDSLELTNQSKSIDFVVAHPRIIKIVSLEDGQVFDEGQPITFMVEARDTKGKIVTDRLNLLLDGKEINHILNSLCDECSPKQKVLNNLKKGTYKLQVVAKTSEWNGVITGESETITITVK